MDSAVHSPVAPVRIRVERRVDAGVVKCCVEAHFVFLVSVWAGQQAKVLIPFIAGLPAQAFEAPRVFRHQVGPGVLFRDAGDGGAQGHFLSPEAEFGFSAAVGEARRGCFGEFYVEVDVLFPGPAAGNSAAADPARAGVDRETVQRVAVAEVQGDFRPAGAAEAVFVHSGAPACGHPCEDLVGAVPEQHFVVAGDRFLIRVGETPGAAARGYEHVAPVVAAGAGKMGVAESVDEAVGVVVAAATVPVAGFRAGVGAELHHPERSAGSRKGVPVGVGPDKRVDVSGEVLPGG